MKEAVLIGTYAVASLFVTVGLSSCSSHEAVDMGLSVKWATCNIGAAAPEEIGDYYAWGETETKDSYTDGNYKFAVEGDEYGNMNSKYNLESGKDHMDDEDDVARAKWGGKWRMPTKAEMEELVENCTWAFDTLNTVAGYRATAANGNSIFFPATGMMTDHQEQADKSYCWSSDIYPNEYGAPAYRLCLYNADDQESPFIILDTVMDLLTDDEEGIQEDVDTSHATIGMVVRPVRP